QTTKAGIHQPTREAQRVALNRVVTVNAAIFLSPQPALSTAQLQIRPAAEVHAGSVTQRRCRSRLIFPARRCRVVVEIADCRLPRGVIAHGQGGVDLPALSLYFRAVSRGLR